MNKKFFVKFCGLLAFVLAALISCEIGLGESVDTSAPEGKITSPGVNAVIRDAFMMKGSWKDDGSIKSVQVNLKSTDKTLEISKNYEGSATEDGWNVVIDPVKEGLLDGKYEATVTLTDNGGHSSSIKRSYVIDNTAPVVVLSYLKSAGDSSSEIKTYGKVFSLSGKAADANNIDKVDIKLYNQKDGECLATVTKLNLSGAIDETVATFGSDSYTKLYGSESEKGSVQCYCRVFAYDEAQRYPADGSEQTDEDKLGNCRNSYWLQTQLELLGYDKYKLSELYAMYSGTYDADGASQDSGESVTEIKDNISNKASVSLGTFNLNPKNNPSFTVIGLNNVLKTGDSMYDDEKNSQKTSFTVTNGDKDTGIPLTITITPGIDNYSLKEDTVKIWFQKCDKDGNLDENAEKIMIAEKTSSCETKPVSVENYTGLETDSYYRICVEGQDTKGNEIEAKINGCYAFYLAPVNGVIELNLSTAPYGQGKSDFIPETAYISSETGDDDYKALKVTLSYSYSGDKVLKVYRKFDDEVFEKDDQPIGTATEIGNEKDYFDIINAEDLKNHTQIKYFLKNEDSSNYSRVKTIEIKRDDARPEIFNPDDGDKKISIPGAADTSNSAFSFKGYASDTLPGSGLSKVFVKLYETKKAVNGEEVEDEERSVTKEASGSEAWSLQVIRDDKSYDKVLKKTEKDANGQDVTYDAQGKKKVEIWAVDKVGLESEHIVKDWIYKTSIPVLKTTYYKVEGENDIPKSIDLMKGSSESLILKDDFTLKGIAEDGYGVKKIEVIQTFNGDTSTSKTLTTEENGGIEYDSAAKTWLIKNSNLNSGIYTYEFTVYDEAGLKTKGNTKLSVTVDKAAPSVESAVLGSAAVKIYENESVKNESAWYSSKSLKLLVNVKEALSDIDWVKYSKTGSNNDDEWFELNPVSGEKNKFRETIELSEGKDQNLFVKVRNNAGRESEPIEFSINIDESEAELSGLYYMVQGGSLKNAGGTAYTNGSKKITLYGSCYDLQSGISGDLSFKIGDRDITAESIKYYIVDENDAENHPDLTKASDFETADFSEDYSEDDSKKIRYFKAVFTPESSDSGKLTLIASNGAGKDTKISVFTITSDAKAPEVSEITIKSNSDKLTVFSHKDAEGKIDCYYLNNSAEAGVFYTISGLAEDNADQNNPAASGVDTVSLEIEGLNDAEGKTKVFSSTKGLYFADLDLSTISTAETRAKLTVTDNAGNQSEPVYMTLKFDTKAPVGLHAYDNSDKDLYFRIGDQNRDSGLKDDGKTAVSGAPAWNKNSAGQAYGPENKEINVDEDVGGKYSSDTFGNAETIKIRGTFDDDSGSGIRQIYYKVYSVKPDSPETGSENTEDFLKNYATLANGSFSLISELNGQTLEQQGIRRVFYSPVTGGIRNTLGKPIETSGENAGSITENGKTSNWVNISSNFKTTISGLALDQANYLVLVAVDNVGNAALDSVSVKEGSETNAYYKINVDKTVPEIKAEETSGILYSNGSKRLSLKGSVKDTNAGIREVELYASIDNKEITFPVTLKNGDTDVTLSSPRADRRDLTWSADIDTSVFKDTSGKLISGSVTLSVRARDDAGTGNITSIPAATIIMDNNPPEVKNVKISTGVSEKHENTSQVNGIVTISGEASDDKALAEESGEGNERTKTLALYYTTKESVAANKPVAGENGSIGDDAASKWKLLDNAEQSANWSFSVDTTGFKDKSDVWFCVAALDAAGNTGYSDSAKVYVNQDTDRPVIKLTNLELGADTSAEKPKRFANNEIYGNVSDDDGIPESISCYVGTSVPEADSTKWITPAENSDFTYSNGSFTLRLAENSNTVWFKIGDFVSSSITNLDTDENKKALQKSVKLLDSKGNKYGYLPENGNSVKATALYTIIDIQPPSIKDLEWSYPVTSGGAEWKSASSMPSAGGTGKKHQMNFRVYAYDATGVNSVKLEIPANANDNLADDSSTKAALSGNSYVYSLVKDESKTEEDDEGNTYFMWSTSSPIDVSGMESSTRECKLIISDSEVAAEAKTTRETFSIKVDNTPAEFEFTSHKNEDTVYGVKDIEIRGNVTSNDMAHVYYYLTKGDVENAAAAKTEIGDKWKEVKFEENKTSTVLAFDMQNNNVSKPEDENHDLQLRQWLASLYNVSNIDAYNDTKSLKIWVYVTDAMDNDSEPLSLYLNVIPNGDKPVVSISYPEEGAKLGGTIRFSGESSIETSSVSKVYAQILVPGASSENWVSELDKLISEADNKSNGKEPYYKVSEIEIDSKKVKVVEVSGTPNSWNFSINGHHELEKDGETPDYTVNFIAVSETGKKSDIVSRTIQIDKNAPVITFELVKLKDAAKTGSEKFAESNIEKRISYKEDMWISGSWYLTGSAADDNGIKELIWNDVKTSSVQSHTLVKRDDQSNTGSIESANADKVATGQEHTTKYKDPTDPAKEITIKANDYNFYIPIETSGSFGSVNYSVSAVDATSQNNGAERTVKINYDNQSPVFKACESSDDAASELAADGNKIQNHSGMYSLYGTFDEDGNQSGFERIVMYFTRTIESKTSIIDPMAAKTLSESDEKKNNYYDISAFNPYSSVEAGGDGIYWKELTATSVDNDTISLTVSDDWVRKGGLCKVDGVIYRIKSVSASEIKIEGSLKESTSKKVFVSPALVIDNLSSEGKKGSEYSGLYNKDKLDTIAISGGDGDWMIEGVSKQGTSYPWTASINSHNLLDGPVTIHFVAFDKAGNASEKAYSGSIANNAPRLAGLTVWTDYNGNGKGWRNSGDHAADYENETKSRYYSRVRPVIDGKALDRSNDVTSKLIVSANPNDAEGIAAAASSAFMKVTDTVKFIPEIVGGNGALFYEYKIGKKSAFTLDEKNNISKFNASETAGSKALKSASLAAITDDEGSAVLGSDDGQNIPQTTDDYSVTYVNGKTDGVITFTAADILSKLDTSTSTEPTWFDLVISDSTEGDSKLSCEMQVALQVNYIDGTAPWAKIKPFHWASRSDNSLAWNGDNPLGHIELEDDLTSDISGTKVNNTAMGDDPKVSGKIKLEGSAFDDIRLKKLYARFTDHKGLSSYKLIAEYDKAEGEWTGKQGDGWEASVENLSLNSEGHRVKWTVILDTAQVAASAKLVALDRAFTVYAVDAADERDSSKSSGNSSESEIGTDQTAKSSDVNAPEDSNWTAYYKMDVVPYITEVVTHLSPASESNPSVFARTALGKYPVYEGETIQFTGFNIGTNTAKVTVQGMTETQLKAGSVNNESTDNTITLTRGTGSGAKSGDITLTVEGIPALNNKNNDDAKGSYSGAISDSSFANGYNRQPNGINNNNLNDNVSLDVWQFLNAAEPRNGKSDNPTMKISSKGRIGISYSNAVVYFSAPFIDNSDGQSLDNIKSQTAIAQNYGWFTNNTFCFDQYGYPYAAAQSPDTDNSKGAAFLQFFSRKAGKNITDMGLNENYQKIANSSRIEAICIPINANEDNWTTDIDRTQSICMATSMPNPDAAPGNNNKVTIHMAYWDNLTKQIRYRQGQVGANPEDFGFVGNGNNYRNYGGSLLDLQGRQSSMQEQGGRFEGTYDSISSKNTNGNNAVKDQRIYRVAGKSLGSTYAAAYQITTDKHGGKYVDIGVLPSTSKTNPTVVLCWYDADAKRLVVSYDTPKDADAKDNTGMCNGNWQTNASYIGNKGGMYCRMAIDADDGIHIAHYDYLGANLLYTYIPSTGSVPQLSSARTFVVDSYLSVGTWCTIDVAKESNGAAGYNYVPQIGYFTPACEDSTAAARIAKAAKFDEKGLPLFNGAENDKYTGAWEISVVPTEHIPIIDRVNVGMYKDAAGVLQAIPTGGKNRITVSEVDKPGYPVSDSTTVYGNGTTNPAVLYCLDDGPVELAQKK